ncbi:M14 family metallopeptidase [Mariniblastus fucicola]|nr:M14 family metallopeptidase [Mariniblastus fucicola]
MTIAILPGFSATVQDDSPRSTQHWPDGVECDESIPTPREFFGFDIGFRHLAHAQVADYVRKLAEVSDRISVEQYATTHGGRPLLMLTITSQENRDRLDEIREQHFKMTKPDASEIDEDAIEELPAIINMGYGVHGDEPSATNCAPLVAYYLAAAKGPEVEKWLNDCVILLDPSLNPDGFNRFANWANRYRGVVPNPDPAHAEHNQMWPPGRVNYYWFDLNRDWLPAVHPESRGRLNWYHDWKPNVVLDFHEMGTNSTFFFQPGIPQRTNPMTPAKNQELTRKFASYHAKALDKRGSLYFTQERFDDFYMGKGSTYPDLHGCVGILFEQASSRGHVQKNQDGILKFSETIGNQFTTSLSSLRATSAMRSELIQYKQRFYRQALKMSAKQKVKTWLFNCEANDARLKEFAMTLHRHDIESYWLKEDFEYGDETFQAGFTLAVPSNQSEYRFLRSLLMRKTDFKENIFYDVSSWTLPLAYGLKQTRLKKTIDADSLVRFSPLDFAEPANKSTVEFRDDDLGYFVDFRSDAAPKLLGELLANDIKVRVAKKPFRSKAKTGQSNFGYGTLSIPLQIQKDKRDAIVEILKSASNAGASVVPVAGGLSASGPDVGSPTFSVIEKPSIAMVIGSGVSAYSAGEVWHLLDEQYRMPVTLLKQSRFADANLDDYKTLIFADGRASDSDLDNAKAFAKKGGTVIVIGKLTASVAKRLEKSPKNDTNGSAKDLASSDKSKAKKDSEEPDPIQKPFDSASNERALKLISGAIFKAKADLTHPLLYGFTDPELAVFRNHAEFLKPSSNPYCNPVIYDAKKPLMAGYCSEENVEKFKGSASVVVHPTGRGRFILLADNPNFRGFWKATNRLFMNAIFFGDKVNPGR